MMYLFDFARYVFSIFQNGLDFLEKIGQLLGNVFNSLGGVITAFPLWLSIPFFALLSIAIVFRISQFIPTIGGASNG